MTAECVTCARPLDGVAYACQTCADRARGHLNDIAEYAQDAQDAASGVARYATGGVGGHGDERLPGDAGAGAVIDRATTVVVGWARHLGETRGIELPTPGRTAGPACLTDCRHRTCDTIRWGRVEHPAATAARLLAARDHLRWLRHRPEAGEAIADMHQAARDIRRAADRPPDLVFTGACPCGQWIYARERDAYARCRGCGERYDVERSREILRDALADRLLTAAEIATLAARAGHDRQRVRGLINVWAGRGVIVAHGRRTEGPVFRVGDVMTRLGDASQPASVGA